MAKQLKKIFIPTSDEVVQNFKVQSWHVSQSVDALTGNDDYDITISGSLTVSGSVDFEGLATTTGQTDVLVLDGNSVKVQTATLSVTSGTSGTSGSSGISGTSGSSGTSGTSGSSGTSGTSGSSGTSGTSGSSGTSGTSGSSGNSGSSGTSGVSIAGSSGTSGTSGSSGTSGTSGSSGDSGSSGTSGLTCYQYSIQPSTSGQSTITYDSCDCANGSQDLIILPPIDCGGAASYSGGVGYPVQQPVNFGTSTGTVAITCVAYSVPDRFIVEYNGTIAVDSGYRGSSTYNFGGSARNSFTASLSQSIDPSTGNTYPFTGTSNESDGYPTVTSPGTTTITFDKNLSTVAYADFKVYAPMTNTAWDADIGCPNGESSPTGTSTYTATVFATSTPSVTSGETDVTISCLGIAGSIDNSTPGGGASSGGNGDNNYIRVVQDNLVYSIDESVSGYTIETDLVEPGNDEIQIAAVPTSTGQIRINTGSAGGAGDYYYLFTEQLNNSGSIRIVGAGGADYTFSDLSIGVDDGFIIVNYETKTGSGTYAKGESATTFDVDAEWYEYSIPRGYNRIAVQNLSDTINTPFILRADSTLDVGDDAILEIDMIAGSSRTDYAYFYNVGHASSSFYKSDGNQLFGEASSLSLIKVLHWESGSNNKGLVPLTSETVTPL